MLKKILGILVVAAVLAVAGSAFANRGYGRGMWNSVWSGSGCGWNRMGYGMGGMMRWWDDSFGAAKP